MNIKQMVLGFGVALAAVAAQASVIVSVEGENQFTTTRSGVLTYDFTSGCEYAGGCDGDYAFVSGTSGIAAVPYLEGNTNTYLAVPHAQSTGSVQLNLGGKYNYFGLFWGSIDTYNSIAFFLDGKSVGGVIGGGSIATLTADGGQNKWASNRYVNFDFTDGLRYDTVVLSSNGYAFESDNHTFGNVPEPSSLALLAAGMLGLGFARRMTRK